MKAATRRLVHSGVKSPPPGKISPMLCTLTKQVTENKSYIHEIKFDGYRIVVHCRKAMVQLSSRSGLDYTSRYPGIAAAFKKLRLNCIIDGEVCALNKEGLPDFDTLQKPAATTALVFYAFDILWCENYNLMQLPLLQRKQILSDVIKGNKAILYSDHFSDGQALFRHMQELGMEGIVSKRSDSFYIPGERGSDWLKTPAEIRQEFVIGGWVESDRRAFRTLLFGAYKNNRLEWIGHAGGGFKHRDMPVILQKLKSLAVKKSPFANEVEYEGVVHWVKPVLVGNFKFATFTKSGRIRKPATFLNFRQDKNAEEVTREIPVQAPQKDNTEPKKKLPPLSKDSNWRKIEKQNNGETEKLEFEDCSIDVYDIDRSIWKGISKIQLIQYYHSVSKIMLPHIENRPQSLHVKLNGANAPGLYIKDMEGRQPECSEIFSVERKHKKPGKRNVIDYLVCNNEATLLYMINLGCIDVNPWTSRATNPGHPDYVIIDLDPSDNDFAKAIVTGQAAKQFLEENKIKSFVKTSGKTGLHIYLPCRGYTFPQARSIAENICSGIHELVPDITTTNVSISSRGTKLYLDPNQNDYADTVAAPYSARPFHLPTVSTPLEWKEVTKKLDPTLFTIESIDKRIKKKGELFIGVGDPAIAQKNRKPLSRFLS
jgi:bifunctional non-homologous end joining protein LigD